MKNPVQVISKVLVVISLLIGALFLEGCHNSLEEIFKLPPEQMPEAFIKFKKQQKEKEEALNKQKAELDREKEEFKKKQEEEEERLSLEEEHKKKEAEEHKKQQEEWEKQRQQEEEKRETERKKQEEKEHLEREELNQKKKELEEKQLIIDGYNKKKLDQEDLDSQIKRVAKIIESLAHDANKLEKTIEELTPHGKVINQALKDRFIGYNLCLKSNETLTNTDVAILVNHPRFEELVEFKLDSLTLSKPQLRALLSHLDNLRRKTLHKRTLHISYEQVEVGKVSNLVKLFQLEDRGFDYLTLHGGNPKDEKGIMQDLGQNLDRLAGLEYLQFNNTCFLTLAPSLKSLPDLRYLNLDGCALGDTGMQTLAPCFKGITYLVGLDLSDNNLGPVGAQALADHLKDLPNLRIFKLDLNYNIGLKGIQALAPQLRHLSKLIGFSLFNTLVHTGATGAQALDPYLKDLPQLQMLVLRSNNLTDEGIKELIPNFQKLPKLCYLDLSENQISSVSAKPLVQYLNTVKKPKFHLYLGKNQLGDTGIQFFLNLSKDLNPCYMYVEVNNISNEMASKLQQLSHINWSTHTSLGSDYNSNIECHSIINFGIDNYKTSSKKSIIDSKD